MKKMNTVYEEYLTTDGLDNLLGYYDNYDDAVNAAGNDGIIYGAQWVPSKFKGLLHKEWSEIK